MPHALTGRKFIVTYRVRCLDVHGHGPDECGSEYGCPCVGIDPATGEEIHDPEQFNDGECDAEYTVNNSYDCGSIEVEADEEEYTGARGMQIFAQQNPEYDDIVRALVDGGFLKPNVKPNDVTIDGESDGLLMIDDATDGEPLFQLNWESSVLDTGD